MNARFGDFRMPPDDGVPYEPPPGTVSWSGTMKAKLRHGCPMTVEATRRVRFHLKDWDRSLVEITGRLVGEHVLITSVDVFPCPRGYVVGVTLARRDSFIPECHVYRGGEVVPFKLDKPLYKDAELGFLPASARRRLRKDRRWCVTS